jgi:hypothetical protein
MCLYPYLSSMQSACAVLYFHLWSVLLYHIFSQLVIFGKIFIEHVLKFDTKIY